MKFNKILILGLGLISIQSAQAFVSVGSSGCTFTTIQAAINSGETEIHIASTNTYNENLNIVRSTNLKLIGGYATCADANGGAISATKAIIDGQDLDDSIFLRINGVVNTTVTFENLEIKGGDAFDLSRGSGVYVSLHSVGVLNLKNMNIHNNKGGGVYIGNGANTVVNVEDSQISSNTATGGDGGGLYCGGGKLNIHGTSRITSNVASKVTGNGGNGGGIALKNCELYMYSGYDSNAGFLLEGVVANSANENGGGIYADNSRVEIIGGEQLGLGDSSKPALVGFNQANKGAGIYAFNNSIVSVVNSVIESNTAVNNGGGFYIDNSFLTVGQLSNCWQSDDNYGSCSRIRKNKSGNYGGGIYVNNGGSAFVVGTLIHDNRADYGTAVYVINSNSTATLMSSTLFANGDNGQGTYTDNYVIRGTVSATVNAYHITMEDNDINDANAVIGIASSSVLNLKNSIVSNIPQTVLKTSGSVTINANCVFVNENTSISGTNLSTADPDTLIPTVETYHLSAHATAADYCPSIPEVAVYRDIDNNIRVYDDPTWSPNIFGPADAGADETILSDTIFGNSFEDQL